MTDQSQRDGRFDAMTARLLQREALRRATEEINTTSPRGLEGVLARISATMTAEAAERRFDAKLATGGPAKPATPTPQAPQSGPIKP